MTPEVIQLLRSGLGRRVLDEAAALQPSTARYPACVDRLNKHFPDALARAALDIVLLRPKAALKFSRAAMMLFDREGLEMASHERVAQHHAERFAGYSRVADLCCGIGSDAIALAQKCRQVTAVDLDPTRLAMTAHNLAAHGVTADCQCADALVVDLSGVQAVFADPNRRTGARRPLDPDEYQPSLPALLEHLKQFPIRLIGVKIAPGVAQQDWQKYRTETEFVSLKGELKEAILWFGPDAQSGSRATILPSGLQLSGSMRLPPASEPKGWIYDPDPAVVRAQQLGTLAQQMNAAPIDDQIALLSQETYHLTPFAKAYPLEAVLPFHDRKIQEWLRNHNIGRLTLLQRGSGLEADKLQKRWKLAGAEHRILILTKVLGQVSVLICGESTFDSADST